MNLPALARFSGRAWWPKGLRHQVHGGRWWYEVAIGGGCSFDQPAPDAVVEALLFKAMVEALPVGVHLEQGVPGLWAIVKDGDQWVSCGSPLGALAAWHDGQGEKQPEPIEETDPTRTYTVVTSIPGSDRWFAKAQRFTSPTTLSNAFGYYPTEEAAKAALPSLIADCESRHVGAFEHLSDGTKVQRGTGQAPAGWLGEHIKDGLPGSDKPINVGPTGERR